MKGQKQFRTISRFTALFLLSVLFTQHVLICLNASATPIPEQVETAIVIQNHDAAEMAHPCATDHGCAHPCHFTTMSAPDQGEGAFLPDSYPYCPESFSPQTAIHAVFHPPTLS